MTRKTPRPPRDGKCRANCPAPKLTQELRAVKDRLHAMEWGVAADPHDVAQELNDALHDLADRADPVGSGASETSSGDRTKARLAVMAPRRTVDEQRAHYAHRGLVRDVQAAVRRAMDAVTLDDVYEFGGPGRPPRVRCVTQGCKGRRNGPHVRFCGYCGTGYPDLEESQ